jgi:oxygen-independent coproporphyrinogen-3 oxidase
VRRYLREFLSDPDVIRLPPRMRWMNKPLAAMIALFRAGQSAEAYRTIWGEDGSPLKVITEQQTSALEAGLPGGWSVFYAMRYGRPSVADTLRSIADAGIHDLVVVPMYPQFSGPTTGTALDDLYRHLATLGRQLHLTVRTAWFDDVGYVDAQARLVHRLVTERELDPRESMLVFSAHSMPESYIRDGDPYQDQILRSVDMITERLGWPRDRMKVAYQSKLGPVPWLSPSTEQALLDLAGQAPDVVVCPISFTADCLETLEEIGIRYRAQFEQAGGRLHLCPALNTFEPFIDMLRRLVLRGVRRAPEGETAPPPLLTASRDAVLDDDWLDSLVMVGASLPARLENGVPRTLAHVTPEEFRRLKRPQEEVPQLLRSLRASEEVDECWLWNTCSRFELYGWVPGDNGVAATERPLDHALRAVTSAAVDGESVNVLRGRDALHHLLRTAAGLNSRLPGDGEVVEQMEVAHELADRCGAAGSRTALLADEVRACVQHLQTQTAWGGFRPEYCTVALKRVALDLDVDWPRARCVVVGGSVTAVSTVTALREHFGVLGRNITVADRNHRRGRPAAGARRCRRRRLRHRQPVAHRPVRAARVRPRPAGARADDHRLQHLRLDRRRGAPRRRASGGRGSPGAGRHRVLRQHARMPGLLLGHPRGRAAHPPRGAASHPRGAARRPRRRGGRGRQPPPSGALPRLPAPPPARHLPATTHDRKDPGMISAPTTTIDMATFERYAGLSLPRHVSYPMPTWWHDATDDERAAMRRRVDERPEPIDLSLYLHIPFCQAMCKFCACCRVVLRKTAPGAGDRAERYVSALEREIRALGAAHGRGRPLRQIHWGGGTPTYLELADIERLGRATIESFDVARDAEISIEVDPRVTTRAQLDLLRRLGFNRISLGVQDFDAHVQEHVKRIQPFEMVQATVDDCREAGFESVNFDLIYGLPYQTLETIHHTLEQVVTLAPDRVAYYHYAQIPEKIATQVAIHHHMMPDSETKLRMFLLGTEVFGAAGYDFVGLDHFARPDEGLARAAADGTLQRNFQGMTTGGGLDLIAAGASSISQLHRVGFLQNIRNPDEYADAVHAGRDPIVRSRALTEDDCIRQAVISQIYCGARIVPAVIEADFDVDFPVRFERELEVLRELEADGLVALDNAGNVDVTFPLGRVLLRNVAAVFDAYLEPDAWRTGELHCFSANA